MFFGLKIHLLLLWGLCIQSLMKSLFMLKKKKKKRSLSGKSYILYGFEICFSVFKILSMAYLIFCLYVRYWQPWLLLKCRSKAASLHGLYSPFELFFPLINLTMYIATIQEALCIAKLSAEKKLLC